MEVAEGREWRAAARAVGHRPELLIPVSGGGVSGQRIRLGSLDGRGRGATLETAHAQVRATDEAAATRGLGSGVSRVELAGPGTGATPTPPAEPAARTTARPWKGSRSTLMGAPEGTGTRSSLCPSRNLCNRAPAALETQSTDSPLTTPSSTGLHAWNN